MAGHLLVTNDFPPKIGGIQSYLWELWRRLPPGDTTVLTTPHADAEAFDRAAPMRIVRTRQPVLLPTPGLAHQVRRLADETGAGLVVLDPALPLGLIGPALRRPYAVLLHGAEVTVPGRLPVSGRVLAGVLRRAYLLIAAGPYPAAEAARLLGQRSEARPAEAAEAAEARPRVVLIPPGVDPVRFHPIDEHARQAVRRSFGLPADGRLVVSVSRLVPRKGMDTLIAASRQLAPSHPDLTVAIAGRGRDLSRLKLLSRGAPVRFLDRVPDEQLPGLYGAADVFAMVCRDRWGGLEQEGFGIVFVEAAACGVPQVAGDSGGAADAVVDGETGLIVRHPSRAGDVAAAIGRLLDDDGWQGRLGAAARARAERLFNYDTLAAELDAALAAAAPAAPAGDAGDAGDIARA
jgi:phosphatidylinositol alpha-1,6-mannosyltransferase